MHCQPKPLESWVYVGVCLPGKPSDVHHEVGAEWNAHTDTGLPVAYERCLVISTPMCVYLCLADV